MLKNAFKACIAIKAAKAHSTDGNAPARCRHETSLYSHWSRNRVQGL